LERDIWNGRRYRFKVVWRQHFPEKLRMNETRLVAGFSAFNYYEFAPPPTEAAYFGGCSSLESQRSASSDFRGSGCSQSMHWNVRRPLPPGGSAKVR
jgi:hypothetical protein